MFTFKCSGSNGVVHRQELGELVWVFEESWPAAAGRGAGGGREVDCSQWDEQGRLINKTIALILGNG